ncbi:MAG TPA: DUF2075 domain-containing protein [Humisphaera sp.]|jgi:hypothetical protein|nr:DUF2075 domain-containing protein [Humisphaera sp.]
MSSVRYTLDALVTASVDEVLGRLAQHNAELGFSSFWADSVDAWRIQLDVIQRAFRQLICGRINTAPWHVLLEYTIPLRNQRPDVVILTDSVIFVVEFKVGATTHESAAVWQAHSYALDLRDFHPGCRDKLIVPILVATNAAGETFSQKTLDPSLLPASLPVLLANPTTLGSYLCQFSAAPNNDGGTVNPAEWESAVYSPTPTIIEAAQALFSKHSVREISHAFSDTLETTSAALINAIAQSRAESCRKICFVTGIPGSGKTLVGLNAVHSPLLLNDDQSSAIFLSGNGSLIQVIREALARDQIRKRKIHKKEADRRASSFIANIHGFLREFGINKPQTAPNQHVIVFDEAQRAWSAEKVKQSRKNRRSRPARSQAPESDGAQDSTEAQIGNLHGDLSEPALILDIMERVPGWATIIALVGGGQEINTGEAGLPEWGRALALRGDRWQVLMSPHALAGGESVAGQKLFSHDVPADLRTIESAELHLACNVRSHRAKFIGAWVNQLLANGPVTAETPETNRDFPIVMTRDPEFARDWLREREEKSQRTGLLTSSGATRLRAFGIEVSQAFRDGISYPRWFLNDPRDIRSSCKLEIAATEYDCQGLEVDWAGICWGGDFIINSETGKWDHWRFRGNSWQHENDVTKQQYIANKYRVLLTRARRGMIIWIPKGREAAKNPSWLDATAERIAEAGVPTVS